VIDNTTYDHSLSKYMELAAIVDPVFPKADCQIECGVVQESVWCKGMPYITFPLEVKEAENATRDWNIIDRCPF
jgi:hypothetical protein